MTRLEKYLLATATEIIESETIISRYFVVGNIKVRVDLKLQNGSVNEDMQIFLTCTSVTYKEILNIYKVIVVDNNMVPTIKLLQEAYALG